MSKWIVDIHGDIEGDYELICKAESAISLDKVKQAREEMEEYVYCDKYDCINEDMTNWICASEAVAILDKLIAESEEK